MPRFAAARDHVEPVIDGVEGTFAKAPSADSSVVKFIGNRARQAARRRARLRHKGWERG